jgi:hypothetical protein
MATSLLDRGLNRPNDRNQGNALIVINRLALMGERWEKEEKKKLNELMVS